MTFVHCEDHNASTFRRRFCPKELPQRTVCILEEASRSDGRRDDVPLHEITFQPFILILEAFTYNSAGHHGQKPWKVGKLHLGTTTKLELTARLEAGKREESLLCPKFPPPLSRKATCLRSRLSFSPGKRRGRCFTAEIYKERERGRPQLLKGRTPFTLVSRRGLAAAL